VHRILALGLFVAATGTSSRAEEPRKVIERAIQVQGGTAVMARASTFQSRIQGTYLDPEAAFTGELGSQLPSRFKLVMDVEFKGGGCVKQKLGSILDGDRGWTMDETGVRGATKGEFTDMQQSAYLEYVVTLVPLLGDKEFTLSLVGESKVNNAQVVGVKVVKAGQPDVLLFFDIKSGFLVKTRHRRFDPDTSKEVIRETVYSDYREINATDADLAVLQAAKIDTSEAGLLDYLRRRTLTKSQRDQLRKLIKNLGDSAFDVREQAKKELIARGEPAVGLLNEAVKSSDAEVSNGAKECLEAIGKAGDSALPWAVIRVLGQRHSADTVRSLLAYLPVATNEDVASEARAVLASLAYNDGKPGRELEDALRSDDPQVKAAAAAVVALRAKDSNQPAGQRVLTRGLKYAMKGVEFRDGKKTIEWQITDITFLNRLDDAVFAKPSK
jgi:hypothetical protein